MSIQGKNTPDSRSEDARGDELPASAEELAAQLAEHQRGMAADAPDAQPAFDWLAPAEDPQPSSQSGSAPVAGEAVQAPGAPMRQARPLPEAVRRQSQEPPSYTEMLSIRPPEDEVERRNSERVQAADTRPVMPRFWQVIVALCFPVLLLAAVVRLIATPLFLWIEYYRPGFPADTFGFSADDRLTYGSYTVDYLNNLSGPRYLGDLVGPGGQPLFQASEVSHMADVKLVYGISMLVALIMLIIFCIGVIYLRRRSAGGVRRALFASSAALLVLIIGLAVLALLDWQRFFTGFHQVFFADGTWVFAVSDTLIRLFPGPFWTDSALVIGALVLLAASLVFALTWPTHRRRQSSIEAQRRAEERRAGKADQADRPQRPSQGRRAAS